MAEYLYGKDAVLYQSSTLITAIPSTDTWAEYANVMDVNANLDPVNVDVTTREVAQTGFTASENILSGNTVTFQIPRKSADDSVLDALIDAALNKTLVALWFADRKEGVTGTTAQGIAANFSIAFSQQQPVQEKNMFEFTATGVSFIQWLRKATA